ncbi:shufflon system plasmid conjugative transfer pilus tip adhesin PilV [Burkholderia stagnalis]|uniref:shufflon system plasmid conjugative transfer pilus tip adhesin PilV n=1 Tax=Burkholderia stagnalis TaxID=1503054 RepID=UPI000F585050|nr:shufflon system plasmid conjugative transfer pilus tip adhesin PilV [Burkholderia stagnalis]RQR11270.1 shufflon system plasmid conjugative transfer pilus tip adhesin PilV [Burkholderia stagnalis]RQR20299.1 shufflon system plasmid conjugative transfer pilus tip adhesin PilV [Burkholderia stagnalis]
MKRSLKRQRGAITFIETLGVLIVASLLMPSIWGWMTDDADSKLNRATADHDKQVVLAAAQYIKDNYATVIASATATTPATITVPMLQSQYPQMFATGFSVKNPYGQTVTAQAYQPTAGTLDTIIVTSGGQTISEGNMRKIAQLIGGAGGYVSSTNPNVANGVYGAWGPKTIPTTPGTPGAGHMVYSLMFQNGSLVSDYLYRKAVPGHPELNQMNTAIDMGGNNLNNAATVNAQKVVAPAGNNVQVGNSYYYGDGSNSAIRQNGALYIQNQAGTGAADVNVANVNASGNANASLDVVAGRNIWASNGAVTAAWMHSTGSAQIDGNQQVNGSANVNGTIAAGSRLYANEYVQVNGWAAQGGGCWPNGLIANSGNGPLFCQSGVWRNAGGTFSVASYAVPVNTSGQYLGVHAYCAIGQLRGGPQGGFQEVYSDGNNNWWANNTYWPDGQWADPQIVVNCLNLAGAGI